MLESSTSNGSSPGDVNERFFILLDIDSGMVSLRSDPVGQLFFEPDEQG